MATRWPGSSGVRLEHVLPVRPELLPRGDLAAWSARSTRPVPWIVSNPIYVGRREGKAAAAESRPRAIGICQSLRQRPAPRSGGSKRARPRSPQGYAMPCPLWAARSCRCGTRSEEQPPPVPMWRWRLAGGSVAPKGHDRLMFTARANRPTRLSVQLRASPGGTEGERWHRSVYLDPPPLFGSSPSISTIRRPRVLRPARVPCIVSRRGFGAVRHQHRQHGTGREAGRSG